MEGGWDAAEEMDEKEGTGDEVVAMVDPKADEVSDPADKYPVWLPLWSNWFPGAVPLLAVEPPVESALTRPYLLATRCAWASS